MTQTTNPKQYPTKMKEVYDNLSKAEADRARTAILEQCGVTYAVFWNWIMGITPVPKLSKIIISNEFRVAEAILFELEQREAYNSKPKQTIS